MYRCDLYVDGLDIFNHFVSKRFCGAKEFVNVVVQLGHG